MKYAPAEQQGAVDSRDLLGAESPMGRHSLDAGARSCPSSSLFVTHEKSGIILRKNQWLNFLAPTIWLPQPGFPSAVCTGFLGPVPKMAD